MAALLNGFQDATAYRVEFLIEVFGSALVPAAIQGVIWYALFQVGGNQKIGGFTYNEMVHYTLTTLLFSQIRGGDHDFELQDMIRTGALSHYLLRPVSVLEFIYLRGLAPRLFIATLTLSIGLLASPFVGLSPVRLCGGMLLAFIGNIIHYQLGAILATTSFYWEEAYSVLMVKNMVVNLLSGELLPLTLVPLAYSWIWHLFPFYLYVFGPSQYVLGHWSHEQYLWQLLLALGWVGLGSVGVHLSWRIGIKRYSSLGG